MTHKIYNAEWTEIARESRVLDGGKVQVAINLKRAGRGGKTVYASLWQVVGAESARFSQLRNSSKQRVEWVPAVVLA